MVSDDVPPREMKLKASTYWLEVDNSVEEIEDSRHFGPVHTTDILGRAFNIELGDTYRPIMHNSDKAVEEDSRNAWTFPYLINNFSDLTNVVSYLMMTSGLTKHFVQEYVAVSWHNNNKQHNNKNCQKLLLFNCFLFPNRI